MYFSAFFREIGVRACDFFVEPFVSVLVLFCFRLCGLFGPNRACVCVLATLCSFFFFHCLFSLLDRLFVHSTRLQRVTSLIKLVIEITNANAKSRINID